MAQILRHVPRVDIRAVNDRKTLKRLKTREPQIALTLFGTFSDFVGSQTIYISTTNYEGASVSPIRFHRSAKQGRAFWLYAQKVYATSDQELTSQDVLALVNVEANKRRLQLEKAHALQAMTNQLNTKRRPRM